MSERLTGEDGFAVVGDLGTTINGDGIQTLDELEGGAAASEAGKNFYQVVAMALSGSALDGLAVGDFFYNDGTMVLETGDDVAPLPNYLVETNRHSLKKWELSFSKENRDLTAAGDDQTVTRMSRLTNVSGSIEFFEDLKSTFASSRFLETVDVSAVGAVSKTGKNTNSFYGVFLQQAYTDNGLTKMKVILGKFDLGEYKATAGVGANQEYSAPIYPVGGAKIQQVIIALS